MGRFTFIVTVLILDAEHAFAESLGLFGKLDTNKDNKLCSEEFSNIRTKDRERLTQTFKHIDSNEDEYIDQNEWWDMLEEWASKE